jgi:hypothetical protein
MRSDVTEAEGDRLVELSRACVNFSLPTDVIHKNMLRLRKYCIRLMKRCSDPRIYMFMAISYDDRRKRLSWDEKYLRTDPDDFGSFMIVLLDLTDFPERLSTTYARAIRKLKTLVAAGKPLRKAEHGLFFTLLIDMAEKLGRDSDVEKWKRIDATLEKRGRYRFRS